MNIFNLFGKLTLDNKDYTKGIDEAKGANDSLVKSTGAASAASALSWAAVGAAVLAVANKIKQLVVDSTQYADNIKNMAQIYGYTTREIQEIQSVAEQSGKSLERVLRATQSSGKSVQEYLGLTNEQYAEMVDNAYRFNTILGDETIDRVDALGDRVTYLKGQWQAVVTSLLANEEGAEEAVDMFFDNVMRLVEDYTQPIISFAVRLLISVVRGLVPQIPNIMAELVSAVIDAIFDINWVQVGIDIIKRMFQGITQAFGKFWGRLFGINRDTTTIDTGAANLAASAVDIGANDYEVTENVTQRIDLSLSVTGDGTAIGSANAEVVGDVLADRLDEILGRRLNG